MWLAKERASFLDDQEPLLISSPKSIRSILKWKKSVQDSRRQRAKKSSFSKETFPGEYVDCSNPLCYNGGIAVGRMAILMVKRRETLYEATELCKGNEGSPQCRNIYGPCAHYFKVKITATYKEG